MKEGAVMLEYIMMRWRENLKVITVAVLGWHEPPTISAEGGSRGFTTAVRELFWR